MSRSAGFRFGLESEYLLADGQSYKPYWHKDISFYTLNQVLESISLDGIPSLDGLELEPPHRKLMPYVVEGYQIPDTVNTSDILVKGVEIRTPVCSSIEECLEVHQELFKRLKTALARINLVPVALSHHPTETHFVGPPNHPHREEWMWSMEVMATYGPDINIGIPAEIIANLNMDDFHEKINYYAAALAVFSLASPFSEGKPWKIRGRIGKSLRTYRRSIIAPAIEFHPEENNRLEINLFDMTCKTKDFKNFFLLFLTLILDPDLKGRASHATRIYDQGAVAVYGWSAPGIHERSHEILRSAKRTLPQWGFDITTLESFDDRINQLRTPADDLIEYYLKQNNDLSAVLRYLADLRHE